MHPDNPHNNEHKEDNDMDAFCASLFKNRELLGTPTAAKVYDFAYENITDLKGVPEKVAFHMRSNPAGIMIVIKSPSGKFYYINADSYG